MNPPEIAYPFTANFNPRAVLRSQKRFLVALQPGRLIAMMAR